MKTKSKRKKSLFVITGRIGGGSTSRAKRLAAIANGKKGGRPRKNPEGAKPTARVVCLLCGRVWK